MTKRPAAHPYEATTFAQPPAFPGLDNKKNSKPEQIKTSFGEVSLPLQ